MEQNQLSMHPLHRVLAGSKFNLAAPMGLELLGAGLEFLVILLASLLALVLLLFARLMRYLSGWLSRYLYQVVPRRLANILGGLLVCLLLLALANDLIVRHLLHQLDEFYALLDSSSDVGGIAARFVDEYRARGPENPAR